MNRIACSFAIAAIVALAPAAELGPTSLRPRSSSTRPRSVPRGQATPRRGQAREAIEKFKESYRLSKNPLLLYNIALTLDESKQTDNALFYYRKFLSDAPADAAQRAARRRSREGAREREARRRDGDDQARLRAPRRRPRRRPSRRSRPSRPTSTSTTFQHQVVDDAPPDKPLDISATIPENSNVSVILYYRDAGQRRLHGEADEVARQGSRRADPGDEAHRQRDPVLHRGQGLDRREADELRQDHRART